MREVLLRAGRAPRCGAWEGRGGLLRSVVRVEARLEKIVGAGLRHGAVVHVLAAADALGYRLWRREKRSAHRMERSGGVEEGEEGNRKWDAGTHRCGLLEAAHRGAHEHLCAVAGVQLLRHAYACPEPGLLVYQRMPGRKLWGG